jgi:hypothetical protein
VSRLDEHHGRREPWWNDPDRYEPDQEIPDFHTPPLVPWTPTGPTGGISDQELEDIIDAIEEDEPVEIRPDPDSY